MIATESNLLTNAAWNVFAKDVKLRREPRVLTQRQLLEEVGLPKPWPDFINRMLEIGDELGLMVHCFPETAYTNQWNGACSAWSFDTNDFMGEGGSFAHSGVRMFSRIMFLKGLAAYKVAHETAHRLIYEIGMRGLLRRISETDPAGDEAGRLHIFGEMFAEFVSLQEMGLEMMEYWQAHWEPYAYCPVGLVVNPGRASVKAGLTSAQQRATHMLFAYFSDTEDPRPLTLEQIRARPEALANWTVQRGYAKKSWGAARLWQRLYWRQPALREFVSTFVPNRPAVVWLKGGESVEIASLDELSKQFHKFLPSWEQPPEALRPQYQTRRFLQQKAMGTAQLVRLLESDGLRRISAAKQQELKRAGRDALSQLADGYYHLEGAGTIATREAAEIRDAADLAFKTMLRKLESMSPRGVCFTHPAVQGLDMSERIGFDLRPLDSTPWPSELEAQRRVVGTAARVLGELAQDLREVANFTGGETFAISAHAACSQLAIRAQLAQANGDAAACRSVFSDAQSWYKSAKGENDIVLYYQWSWALERPYIEPVVGFRIR